MAALVEDGGGSVRSSSPLSICSSALNSPDAVDPLVLLLGCRGGDSVEGVVSLDDAAVCLRLAGLYHLIFVVWDEELKTVLLQDTGTRRGDFQRRVDEGVATCLMWESDFLRPSLSLASRWRCSTLSI